MKMALISLVLLFGGAFVGVQPANAQQGGEPSVPDPLEGCWTATDTQKNTGSACVCIVKIDDNLFSYSSSSGDSGTITKITGGYAFTSSKGGGSGTIQSN